MKRQPRDNQDIMSVQRSNNCRRECKCRPHTFMCKDTAKNERVFMICDRHPEYKEKNKNRYYWATGCYVGTVGRNEEEIKRYIQNQTDADRIEGN